MSESELIAHLIEAQRAGARSIDQGEMVEIDRAAAYRIQAGVMHGLGERPGVIKTAVQSDGMGVAAPIYASHVGHAPRFSLSTSRIVGLEVEVGVVLSRDVASSTDLPGAIDHFFLGIEVCGTRLIDRKAATPSAGLADNMSAFGYVIGGRRTSGDSISGLDVALKVDGRVIHDAPAKHGFGTVLASLMAYADRQVRHLPLHAGTVITTGSMCGLVPWSTPGAVVASLGAESVSFTLA